MNGDASSSMFNLKSSDWKPLLAEALRYNVTGLIWHYIENNSALAATMLIEDKMVWFGQVRATEAEHSKKRIIAEQYAKAIAPYKCVVLKRA